jgi:hypothetical protein
MLTNETHELISVEELKRLLTDLKEKRPDIAVRFRLLGELWLQHFGKITLVTEKGVVISNETTERLFSIPDLMAVMQFEIDAPFQNFQPFFHFDVKPAPMH